MRLVLALSLLCLGCAREELTPFSVGDRLVKTKFIGGSGENDLFFVDPNTVTHRDGKTTAAVPGTQSFAASGAVAVGGANQVWGWSRDIPFTLKRFALDGSSTDFSAEAQALGVGTLFVFSGHGAIWIVLDDGLGGVFAHLVGDHFVKVPSANVPSVNTIQVVADDDVWVQGPTCKHFDGSVWSEVTAMGVCANWVRLGEKDLWAVTTQGLVSRAPADAPAGSAGGHSDFVLRHWDGATVETITGKIPTSWVGNSEVTYGGLYGVASLAGGKKGLLAVRQWKDSASPESSVSLVLSELDGTQLSPSTQISTLSASCQAPACPGALFGTVLDDGSTVLFLNSQEAGAGPFGVGKLSL